MGSILPPPPPFRTIGYVRWAALVPGVVLIGVGGVWIFQGLGVLEGSFMTGSAFWAWMGAICVLVGLALVARGVRGAGR
jgi:hypothetical protein